MSEAKETLELEEALRCLVSESLEKRIYGI